MAIQATQKSDFITRLRNHAAKEIQVRNEAQALKREWDSLNYSVALVDGDFVGANAGLVKSEATAVITAIGNMETTFASGNNTNFNTFKA